MQFKKDSKYLSIALYTFAVIVSSIMFYLLIVRFSEVKSLLSTITAIFTPITFGLIMAYLFNFFLVIYEDKLLSKGNLSKGKKRTFGIILTYLTVLILFYLFLQFILPQLIFSITGIVAEIPNFVKVISEEITKLGEILPFTEFFDEVVLTKTNEMVNELLTFSTKLLPMIGDYVLVIMSGIWNIVLGLIISIYLLAEKERFAALTRKSTYAILSKKAADKAVDLTHLADNIFGKFLGGKILDSAIIAVLTFVLLVLFKMPYPLLIAFIVGVTNIIPFFGPFIGAIPAFFIILFVSVNKAFGFLALIIVIQQIDGNIIGPKILGDSLGINAFWILFSLLISGKLFGFVGMVIGVPLFAFVYAILKEVLEARLKRKDLPIETQDYMNS